MEMTQLPQNEHIHVQRMVEAGATQIDVARQFGRVSLFSEHHKEDDLIYPIYLSVKLNYQV